MVNPFLRYICVLLFAAASTGTFGQSDTLFTSADFEIEVPYLYIQNIPAKGNLICLDRDKLNAAGYEVPVIINGEIQVLNFRDNKAEFHMEFDRQEPLSIKAGGFTYVKNINPMPLWLSIIPPLLVIVLALVFKEVLSSLLLGVVSGSCIAAWYSSGKSVWLGFLNTVDVYMVDALTDSGHVSVILFSLMIGGIVAVISKNGGMQAIVNILARKAKDAQSGQFITWLLGVAIFFDDYANTLVVGNTMRPLTDKLRISREKLSYIVDSTAAPVAAVALITTWIGAELGYIQDALATINAAAAAPESMGLAMEQSAYAIFLGSLEYAFYPIFTLCFILILIFLKRDFGPMLSAETKARQRGVQVHAQVSADLDEFNPVEGVTPRAVNAILPIAIVVFGTVAGLLATGYDAGIWADGSIGFGKKLSLIIGNSDSYKALLWASMAALIVAVLITAGQRIMAFSQAVEATISGFKTMMSAVVILVLAWSLAAITEELHTAEFLAGLASGNVAAWTIPPITFVLAAVVAFSTGSSWGTMAIVYPLMLPLSWELSMQSGLEPGEALDLFYNVTSCVLAGSVLGDHCSPISDTTILSSLATQCDHIAHVRTQLPYALTVGGIALTATAIAAYFDLHWLIMFPVGIGMMYLVVRVFGKVVEGNDKLNHTAPRLRI